MKSYTVYIYDDIPATHVLAEKYLPEDMMARSHGLIFAPPSYTKTLGSPNDEVTINGITFPAWKAANGEPPDVEFDNRIPY